MTTEPTSKSLKDTDDQADIPASRLEFTLPSAWWSRPKPHAWAGLFVHSGGVMLDTAAGLPNTFRFITQPVSADSIAAANTRIVSLQSVVERLDVGQEEETEGDPANGAAYSSSLDSLRFIQADIAALPYEEGKFDIVFGLSVLDRLATEEAQAALDEFRRVLRAGGLLVLTFDDSFADFPSFARIVRSCGYSFAGEFDSYVSHETRTNSARGRLYAFRAEETN
ncbi:class I SAM-dependent methyltransferase [Paenibacillus kobensis]|uniref:class I SAM-dependent methyltransferase n=1 Tax=Paenibacillus kobensis TaxID=59841 RepID=UPI000FD8C02F|nr:class I SAM-dependent methyltransferase [Paenibacillus kobensis]